MGFLRWRIGLGSAGRRRARAYSYTTIQQGDSDRSERKHTIGRLGSGASRAANLFSDPGSGVSRAKCRAGESLALPPRLSTCPGLGQDNLLPMSGGRLWDKIGGNSLGPNESKFIVKVKRLSQGDLLETRTSARISQGALRVLRAWGLAGTSIHDLVCNLQVSSHAPRFFGGRFDKLPGLVSRSTGLLDPVTGLYGQVSSLSE